MGECEGGKTRTSTDGRVGNRRVGGWEDQNITGWEGGMMLEGGRTGKGCN